jgi:F-type H+-transporting ATPase subunit delta
MPRMGSSARRYAEAAFELGSAEDAVPAWREGLERAALLAGDEELARLLENPAIPLQKRAQAFERGLGDAPKGVLGLVQLLLRRGRIELLPRVADEFRRLDERRQGIVPAVVTSALPLDEAETREIARQLEERTGGKVSITYEVDPTILGGVLVRIGDRLMDGSVRGRLERLRARLTAGAL